MFQQLTKPVSFATTPAATGGSGAAAGLGGSALGVSDLFSGIGSAASNVLNLTTSYQIKELTGLLGSTALNPILQAIAMDHPALRLHLVVHSFGGRLVTATSAGVGAATILRPAQ